MYLVEMFDGNKYRVISYTPNRTFTDIVGFRPADKANFIFETQDLKTLKRRFEYSVDDFADLLKSFNNAPKIDAETLKTIYADV